MKRTTGFTIIEVMIAIVLMAILVAMGMPGFKTYLNNTKLRSTAQVFLAGVQKARGEAIQRNANVDFLLTNLDVSGADLAPTPSNAGQNWMIRTSDLATFIESKFGAEGSGKAAGEAPPVQIAGSVAVITFTNLGATTLGAAATFQFTNPDGGSCVSAGGPMRCLNVVVSPGGQSRLCDPAVSAAATAAGDTRGC
jgi:type IV fimbrial biogenesis protein FimT